MKLFIVAVLLLCTTQASAFNFGDGFSTFDGSKQLAERAVNGSFATDTIWSKVAGWSISGGVAVASSAAWGASINQDILMPGRTYRVTYTMVSVSSGGVYANIGGVVGPTRTLPGTYTDIAVATTSLFGIAAGNPSFSGTIDNVSVR